MKSDRFICLFVCFTFLLLVFVASEGSAQTGRDLTVNIEQAGAAPNVATRTNVAFVVTTSNIRAGAANNVLVTVNVPAGFTAISVTPTPGAGFVCSVSGNVSSCTAATFGGNTQKTFRVAATAPATISGTTQAFTLTARIDPNNTVSETDNANNSDNFSVNVVTKADLTVSLAATGNFTTQVAPNLVYVVTANNSGDREAPNLLVRSTLPRDVQFVRVEENQLGTCAQNSTDSAGALQVNCTLSSLPAGASRHVRIVGRIVGSIPDRTQVTFATNVDPSNTVAERNDTNNTAFLLTTVRTPSDVQVTGTVATNKGGTTFSDALQCFQRSSNRIAIQLTVKNNGPFASRATTVLITWPAGITSAAAAQCFDSCSVPALNSGQSTTIGSVGIPNVDSVNASATVVVDSGNQLFDPVVSNNRITLKVCGATP